MKHKNQEKNAPDEEVKQVSSEDAKEATGDTANETPTEDMIGTAPEEEKQLPRDFEKDVTLFHRLFPDVQADQIPKSVWDRVEAGESLAAAYALYAAIRQKEEEHIASVNRENEEKAPPRIRHDGREFTYFSPEAVKAMSRSEVKKNYDAILASMEKWN